MRRLFCFVAFAVLSAQAQPALAAFPGANGKITFTAQPSVGRPQVFTINPDGTDLRQLTADVGAFAPSWSADGTKIAFSVARDADHGDTEIATMNADGTGVTVLTHNTTTENGASWSPDGSKIVFSTDRHSGGGINTEIYVINADGSGETRLTSNTYSDLGPVWSPDGSKIAFLRLPQPQASGPRGIFTMNPDGTGETQILNDGVGPPDWSPDGTRLTFQSGGVYVMNADGSAPPTPVPNTLYGGSPVFSPDGTRIAFVGEGGPPSGINTINPDGTALTNVISAGSGPDWQSIPVNGYARPKGASPLRVSLVQAYNRCTAANSEHGPPLASPSCDPPVEGSFVEVGTRESNGAAANFIGSVRLDVQAGMPGTPDDADVRITANLTDVRCGTSSACGSPNFDYQGGTGPTSADYVGVLELRVGARVTDKDNTPSPSASGGAATVTDFTVTAPIACAETGPIVSGDRVGSTCSLSTTLDALIPGAANEGKRAIWELGQVQIEDGGPDGDIGTPGNGLFATQGIFVP